MSLFFKKTASVWFNPSGIQVSLHLDKGKPAIVQKSEESIVVPRDIHDMVGILSVEEVLSAVVEVSSELEGELLEAQMQKHFSESLPLEWEDSIHLWELLSKEGSLTRYLLAGVPKATLSQYEKRMASSTPSKLLWCTESMALLEGLAGQIKLDETAIIAANLGVEWLLVGISQGLLIDDRRCKDFSSFKDFYTSFTQQTKVFPQQLLAITEGEWPAGFEVDSVLTQPEVSILPVGAQDLEIRILEGGRKLLQDSKKSGFFIAPRLDSV